MFNSQGLNLLGLFFQIEPFRIKAIVHRLRKIFSKLAKQNFLKVGTIDNTLRSLPNTRKNSPNNENDNE